MQSSNKAFSPRSRLKLQDLQAYAKNFALVKLDVRESLLASPDMKSVMARLQIMQHMRGLMNHHVDVRVSSLVGGPTHVRIVSGRPVASHLDIVRLETIIVKWRTENPARRGTEKR